MRMACPTSRKNGGGFFRENGGLTVAELLV
jgi:hypothetical protein